MKNFFLSLLLAAMLFPETRMLGQENKLEIGLLAGPNRAKLSGNDFLDRLYDAGYYYSCGISACYNLNKRFSLLSGVLYERKGAAAYNIKLTDVAGQQIGKAKIINHIDYAIIPLMARFSFGKKIKTFLSAGGYGAYLLQASIESHSDATPEYRSKTDTLFRKTDFGLAAGLGCSVPLRKRISLSLELRNYFGLYNISALPVYNNQSIRNTAIDLLLGIAYRL